ncbi:MAG: hypothetical protein AB1758_05250 [Candidatus Eremiobacterota bacterium]
MRQTKNRYDVAWKEAVQRYFRSFLEFFFPEIEQDIDWARPPEFLDNELRQMVRDAEVGTRRADLLVRVHRRDGGDAWVLAHVEFQSQPGHDFAHRMYVYYYRIYDRYRRPVASLAILGDPQPDWRPDRYENNLWGCQSALRFPIVKLMDYRDRLGELERSENPFALLTAAQLYSHGTRQDSPERMESKYRLVRSLYDRGLARPDIVALFEFIDCIMSLSGAQAETFSERIHHLEGEKEMRYVTSIERIGRRKGRKQGRVESLFTLLEARFGEVPTSLRARIESLDDGKTLLELIRQAGTLPSLGDFERALPGA